MLGVGSEAPTLSIVLLTMGRILRVEKLRGPGTIRRGACRPENTSTCRLDEAAKKCGVGRGSAGAYLSILAHGGRFSSGEGHARQDGVGGQGEDKASARAGNLSGRLIALLGLSVGNEQGHCETCHDHHAQNERQKCHQHPGSRCEGTREPPTRLKSGLMPCRRRVANHNHLRGWLAVVAFNRPQAAGSCKGIPTLRASQWNARQEHGNFSIASTVRAISSRHYSAFGGG